jgi:hypothetical protein
MLLEVKFNHVSTYLIVEKLKVFSGKGIDGICRCVGPHFRLFFDKNRDEVGSTMLLLSMAGIDGVLAGEAGCSQLTKPTYALFIKIIIFHKLFLIITIF